MEYAFMKLRIFQIGKPIKITTDASKYAAGAVL
jgi:hypothetical protein